MPKPPGKLRKARVDDVGAVFELLRGPTQEGVILPRSRVDLYHELRDFFIWDGAGGGIVGVAALRIWWNDLAEIRSLVVSPSGRGKGVGQRLVDACLDEALMLGLNRVFVLTFRPDFFGRFGFEGVEKQSLPQKIYNDCVLCAKFPDCDEEAMLLSLESR